MIRYQGISREAPDTQFGTLCAMISPHDARAAGTVGVSRRAIRNDGDCWLHRQIQRYRMLCVHNNEISIDPHIRLEDTKDIALVHGGLNPLFLPQWTSFLQPSAHFYLQVDRHQAYLFHRPTAAPGGTTCRQFAFSLIGAKPLLFITSQLLFPAVWCSASVSPHISHPAPGSSRAYAAICTSPVSDSQGDCQPQQPIMAMSQSIATHYPDDLQHKGITYM